MGGTRFFIATIILVGLASSCIVGQTTSEVTRIEFNSGSRTFRQQVILTPDSVVSIEEDFRVNLKPVIKTRKNTTADWQALVNSLKGITISEIPGLNSPTDKRTYDAAAHGSIILTTRSNKSFTHGFDDEVPHDKLKPLMKEIIRIRDTK